jgi:hypothetical protein
VLRNPKTNEEYKAEWDTWAREARSAGADEVAEQVKDWLDTGDVHRELDLSDEGLSTLAYLPAHAMNIDVSNNRLVSFPKPSPQARSIMASSNQIRTIEPEMLAAMFQLHQDAYIDLQNNPLNHAE